MALFSTPLPFLALLVFALSGCATPKPPVSASHGSMVVHYIQGARTPLGVIYMTGTAPTGAVQAEAGGAPA
ncbi:MAG: hypothetical protein ACLFQ5_10375, partial [Oceanicaulis sp.]